MGKGMGGHQRGNQGLKDEWLTPPEILTALGPFDLDPCAPIRRPWGTAEHHYTIEDDGLALPWEGRVWLNPPYGPQMPRWLRRLAEHGSGTALVFARTDTRWFADLIWPMASAVLFLEGRLSFYHVDGRRADNNGGAPSALVAYSAADAARLVESGLKGYTVQLG